MPVVTSCRRGTGAVLGRARRLALCLGVGTIALASFGDVGDGATPESELPEQLRTVAVASRDGMVVTGSPLASRAGAEILAAGGTAVDAAVAAALAIGVAEPGQSGLGGETYVLICRRGGACVAIDGSSTAPLRVSRPALQRLEDEGKLYGYPVVATPATLAALTFALTHHGTMSLARVIAPAIAIADSGVEFSPNQRNFLNAYIDKIRDNPYLAGLLLDDGVFLPPPDRVYCNDDLARTLRRIAERGAEAFYRGEIAGEIADDMAANGGAVSRFDLARVEVVERRPLRGRYRGFDVASFPFPGGGAAVIETLQILDTFPPARIAAADADSRMLQIEAARLAITDEHTVRVPSYEAQAALLDAALARRRAALITLERPLTLEEIGRSLDGSQPWLDHDTTQLTVADRDGTVVSITQTLGHGFGASVATRGLGFPYNSMLEAFDREHAANRAYLLPLHHPYTSQAPTVLLRDGRPVFALGGVGSARITSSVVGVIVNLVDRGMTVDAAVAEPRVVWGDSPENMVNVEVTDAAAAALADTLQERGYESVKRVTYPAVQQDLGWLGGINSIALQDDGTIVGAGDPRRQGAAAAPASPQRQHSR
jgi:gamma-glutamyltranspeptidase/glutathione hydrolase